MLVSVKSLTIMMINYYTTSCVSMSLCICMCKHWKCKKKSNLYSLCFPKKRHLTQASHLNSLDFSSQNTVFFQTTSYLTKIPGAIRLPRSIVFLAQRTRTIPQVWNVLKVVYYKHRDAETLFTVRQIEIQFTRR